MLHMSLLLMSWMITITLIAGRHMLQMNLLHAAAIVNKLATAATCNCCYCLVNKLATATTVKLETWF